MIQPGTRVRIKGLQGDLLNPEQHTYIIGMEGEITGRTGNRYIVMISALTNELYISECNLEEI